MAQAPTSDGEPRPNVEPLAAVTLTAVPISIDDGSRVATLFTLATNLNLILTNKSKPTINVIDKWATYDNASVVSRFNDIVNGVNSVTPGTLTTYSSLDYNAFNSVVKAITTALNTINT